MGEAAASTPDRAPDAALGAWRALLRAHATGIRELDASLRARHGLSVTDYDVLLTLSRGPRDGLRMRELAERTLLSKSGLSGIVDRLSRAGLLRRSPAPGDARGSLAVLTPAGRRAATRAHATQTAVSRAIIAARVTDAEASVLAELLGRLTDPPATR